jgi:hypothetical protein
MNVARLIRGIKVGTAEPPLALPCVAALRLTFKK